MGQLLNTELQERTYEALLNAATGIATLEDIQLLCWHAGVPYEDILEPSTTINLCKNAMQQELWA